MAALEEWFSSWVVDDEEEDDDDDKQQSSPAASLVDEEEADEACEGCVGTPAAAAVDDEEALRYRSGPNTGPKGVLADHRAHQRAVYERAARAKVRRLYRGGASTGAHFGALELIPSSVLFACEPGPTGGGATADRLRGRGGGRGRRPRCRPRRRPISAALPPDATPGDDGKRKSRVTRV